MSFVSFGKRRRKKKQKPSVAGVQAQLNTVKKKIASATEINVGAQAQLNVTMSATPQYVYIVPIGTGMKTKLKSVRVRGHIKQDPTSTLVDAYRIDLVLDRSPAKTEITALLYLGSAGPYYGHFQNKKQLSRYKILRTKMGVFDKGVEGRSIDTLDWYVPLNLIAESDTDGGYAQGNIVKNAIYIVYWSDSAANFPITRFNYRANTEELS